MKDEPTAVLNKAECDHPFAAMDDLKRNGQYIDPLPTAPTPEATIIGLMPGRELADLHRATGPGTAEVARAIFGAALMNRGTIQIHRRGQKITTPATPWIKASQGLGFAAHDCRAQVRALQTAAFTLERVLQATPAIKVSDTGFDPGKTNMTEPNIAAVLYD